MLKWKDGRIVETVDMYRVYKTCTKCGNWYADMWSENRFMKQDDILTTPPEECKTYYKHFTHYKCRNKKCNHRWYTNP